MKKQHIIYWIYGMIIGILIVLGIPLWLIPIIIWIMFWITRIFTEFWKVTFCDKILELLAEAGLIFLLCLVPVTWGVISRSSLKEHAWIVFSLQIAIAAIYLIIIKVIRKKKE